MLISVVRFLIANYFGLFRSLLGRIILDTTPGIPRRIYQRWLYAIVKDVVVPIMVGKASTFGGVCS